jgi:hypothetical protein
MLMLPYKHSKTYPLQKGNRFKDATVPFVLSCFAFHIPFLLESMLMSRASRLLMVLLTIAQVITLVVASQRPAYAYADPGSGLLLIQIASSMMAGALFMVRSKLRRVFRFGKDKSETSTDLQS